MSVDNLQVIDFISEKDGRIVLTISDHYKYEHIYLLQEKINAYLTAIETGQIEKKYPSSKGRQIAISVALKYKPNDTGMSFLSRVNDFLLNDGYEFEYYTL